jgi:hypothetical protein
MMHQPVDLDDYSPLEIEMNMWQRNIEPGSVSTAADAVGEAHRNAMSPSKALNVEKSTRASHSSEAASVAINGSMEGFYSQFSQALNRQTSG